MDIEELRSITIEKAVDGTTCPCCDKYVKLWKKKAISTAIASLVRLVKLHNKHARYYHIDEFTVLDKDRNFSQLMLWALIIHKDNDDPKKKNSGMYKPTQSGIDFVNGDYEICKYIYTLNNKIKKTSDIYVDVHEALGQKFDYQELMADNYKRRTT